MATNDSLKKDLTKSADKVKQPSTIQQWVKAYEGQIAKALPSVLTPERFSKTILIIRFQKKRLNCLEERYILKVYQTVRRKAKSGE